MNWRYPFEEAKFTAKWFLNRTSIYSDPRAAFIGDDNIDLGIALTREDIPTYNCRKYRNPNYIRLYKNTKLWITTHGPFYIPDYNIYRLTHKRKAKWLDTWHAVGIEHGSGKGRALMLNDYNIGLVSSDFYKDYYSSFNPKIEDKLVVTGFPRCDLIDSNSKPENIVLYAPSYQNPYVGGPEKSRKIVYDMETICLRLGYRFIYTTHPNERKNTINPKFDLNKVAVLITDYSSIAADFGLLRRPIIFIDRGLNPSRFVFSLEKRGGYVTSEKEVTETLAAVLENPKPAPGLEDYLNLVFKYQDQNNTERVMKVIKEMMEW